MSIHWTNIALVAIGIMGVLGSMFGLAIRAMGKSHRNIANEVVAAHLATFRVDMDARFNRNDAASEAAAGAAAAAAKKATDLEVELARQFGGNSGGLRQAINEVGGEIASVGNGLATLTGRFDEHIRNGGT